MRELTKSMIRFSWAMSVLTFEQMSTLLGETDPADAAHDEPAPETARAADPPSEEPATAASTAEAGAGAGSGTGEKGSKRKLSDRQKEIAETLNQVVDATGRHLSERARTIYDSGDRLQGEMVDLVFDTFTTERHRSDSILDRTADLMDDMAEALRRAAGTTQDTEPATTADAQRADDDAEGTGASNAG